MPAALGSECTYQNSFPLGRAWWLDAARGCWARLGEMNDGRRHVLFPFGLMPDGSRGELWPEVRSFRAPARTLELRGGSHTACADGRIDGRGGRDVLTAPRNVRLHAKNGRGGAVRSFVVCCKSVELWER